MNISVVIPNFNGKNFLEKKLIDVVKFSKNIKSNILEIIIVDDQSTDDSVKFLTDKFKKEIRLIKHTKHRGYAAAVNTGVRSSRGDIVYVLDANIDIESKPLSSKEKMFEDNKLFSINFMKKRLSLNFNSGYIQTNLSVKNSESSNGISILGNGLFRKRIWQEVGGMDELLFKSQKAIWTDLYFRSAKRGFVNAFLASDATVSLGDINVVDEVDQVLLVWKNIHSRPFIKKHFDKVVRKIFSNPKYLAVLTQALIKMGSLIKLRRRELRDCIVSDEAVFSQYS